MYNSDELAAIVKVRQARAGTPTNLTGYETVPPLTPADLQANAQTTTIPGPQGLTAPIQPGQKVPGYIPVPPGVPQWGMPKSTTNFAAAQYSDTNMNFVSPLALSVERHYKISAIPPIIRGDYHANKEAATQESGRRSDVKNTEEHQGDARQPGGENVQKVSQEGQIDPTSDARAMGDTFHRMNSWYWQ